MVGFLFIQVFIHLRVATHSGWLKAPDLKQMGACNQGKEDLKQLAYSRMHSASSATGENILQWEQLPFSKKMGKCALWGLRGRTPYKSLSIQVGLLIVIVAGGAFCVPSTRHRPHFDKESIKSLLSVIRPVRAASTIERSSKT